MRVDHLILNSDVGEQRMKQGGSLQHTVGAGFNKPPVLHGSDRAADSLFPLEDGDIERCLMKPRCRQPAVTCSYDSNGRCAHDLLEVICGIVGKNRSVYRDSSVCGSTAGVFQTVFQMRLLFHHLIDVHRSTSYIPDDKSTHPGRRRLGEIVTSPSGNERLKF
jgi:hypothetical protein